VVSRAAWAFFAFGTAIAAIIQSAPVLLFFRPGTPGGWLAWFLGMWAVTATSCLFRNPIFHNPFARRLAARTDPQASGARVMYLLVALATVAVTVLLVMRAFSSLVALVHPA
jgi:hypothetical protein